ncbi:MAG: divalent-cation tolerance protein CutA [Pseudomonadota bacterium]|nr:divalent-cation tolerance protein CutA [Pseudomonadota bacterium]
MVYVTANNQEEAEKIAFTVVEENLAACANVLGPMISIFSWKGDLQREEEVAMLLKTTEKNVARLTKRITTLHSYDCPCVLAWPIQYGNSDFLDWLKTETGG